MSGEGSRPPSVSGDIQLRALPAGPERSSRLFGLAPVGGRRFTRSPGNVLAERFILPWGCAVSVPLPWLSPNHFRGPPFSWRRDLPQLGPEALPSVALPLPTILPMKNPYLNKLKRSYSAVQRPVGTPIRSPDMQRLITASYIPKKARGGSQAWPTALD